MRVQAGFLIFALLTGAAFASDPQKGHDFLTRECGGCHAVETAGVSPLAAAPPFRDLGERYPPEDLDEALAEGIITGHPEMPEVVASPQEIDDVIAWLTQIQSSK